MDVKKLRLKTGTIIRDKKLKRDYMLLPEDCDIRVDISEWYEMTKVFNTAMQVYVVSVYYQTLLDMETLKAEKVVNLLTVNFPPLRLWTQEVLPQLTLTAVQ